MSNLTWKNNPVVPPEEIEALIRDLKRGKCNVDKDLLIHRMREVVRLTDAKDQMEMEIAHPHDDPIGLSVDYETKLIMVRALAKILEKSVNDHLTEIKKMIVQEIMEQETHETVHGLTTDE